MMATQVPMWETPKQHQGPEYSPLKAVFTQTGNRPKEACVGLHLIRCMLTSMNVETDAVDQALAMGVQAAGSFFDGDHPEIKSVCDVFRVLQQQSEEHLGISIGSEMDSSSTTFNQMLAAFGQSKWGGPSGLYIEFPNGRGISVMGKGRQTWVVDPHPRNPSNGGLAQLGSGSALLMAMPNFHHICTYAEKHYNIITCDGPNRGKMGFRATFFVPSVPTKRSSKSLLPVLIRPKPMARRPEVPLGSGVPPTGGLEGKGKEEEPDDYDDDDGGAKPMEVVKSSPDRVMASMYIGDRAMMSDLHTISFVTDEYTGHHLAQNDKGEANPMDLDLQTGGGGPLGAGVDERPTAAANGRETPPSREISSLNISGELPRRGELRSEGEPSRRQQLEGETPKASKAAMASALGMSLPTGGGGSDESGELSSEGKRNRGKTNPLEIVGSPMRDSDEESAEKRPKTPPPIPKEVGSRAKTGKKTGSGQKKKKSVIKRKSTRARRNTGGEEGGK